MFEQMEGQRHVRANVVERHISAEALTLNPSKWPAIWADKQNIIQRSVRACDDIKFVSSLCTNQSRRFLNEEDENIHIQTSQLSATVLVCLAVGGDVVMFCAPTPT